MKKADSLSKFYKKALRLLFAVLFVPLFVSLVFIYELSVYDSSRELPADAQKIGGLLQYRRQNLPTLFESRSLRARGRYGRGELSRA